MKSCKILGTVIALSAIACTTTFAVTIDLSGAATGTIINAPGGSFSQCFVGQTVSGQNLTGSPSNPLTLQAGGTLEVASWNGFNTILPQPGNQAPLALLLDYAADSISWTMGYGNPPSDVTIDFYSATGGLVSSVTQSILGGYNTYSYSGLGTFYGLAIYNNDDAAGLRYYDFQYNRASQVPDAGSTVLLLALAIMSLGLIHRRSCA